MGFIHAAYYVYCYLKDIISGKTQVLVCNIYLNKLSN